MKKNRVILAQPYQMGALGSRGNASYMLIRQYQFPFDYSSNEELVSMDSDHLMRDNIDYYRKCMAELDTPDHALEYWFRKKEEDEIMVFLKNIMQVNNQTNWTGFRIMATVSDSGHTIFTYQLFARNLNCNTLVYSGEIDAPNLKR